GYSLRHQEEFLRRYCEINSIQVVDVFKEDYSAKTFIRPTFNNLLLKLKSRKLKADLLIFTKWDRFSRNAPDAYAMISTLNKIGIEPQAVEQPLDLSIPENKIMLAFYLSAPEVENDRRALNTFVGMRRARKEGRWVSSAPKGYDNTLDENNKKIIAPNKYAPIIKWAFETFATGQFGVEEVRQMCNEKGFEFKKSRFYEVLKNPAYCGRIIIPPYKNEDEQIIKGNHEPLITEVLYDHVQSILLGRRFKSSYKICARVELPLRGFLNCPRCGKRLCGSGSTGGSGIKHYYYHCKNGCKERVKAQEVNNAFSNYIATFKFRTEVQEMYEQVLNDVFEQKRETKNVNKQALQKDIDKNKERLSRAQQMMLDGEMEMKEYIEIKRNIELNLDSLLSQQLDFNRLELECRNYLKKELGGLQNLGHVFDRAKIEGKQILIRSILQENIKFSEARLRIGKLNQVILLNLCKEKQ
ncbi:MAG: recombinase family protein, partial [Bacteroidetes bacterium]|nr:recombinase family protein [Bacteroidota bacterium]